MGRVFIIGWDGATFDVMAPLLTQGRLPNVARLMREGAWGRLESSVPPLTPIAWTSISTGVNPGKHGIFDAILCIPEQRRSVFVNASRRKVPPLWSILSDSGKSVGVFNVPVTYPPEKVRGFIVPGMFTPGNVESFMHPAHLRAEIEARFGRYQIEGRRSANPSAYLKSIIDETELGGRIISHLIDSHHPDFLFAAFMGSDRAQHFFWKYLDPAHPEHARHGDAVAKVYETLDRVLGDLLLKVGDDDTLLMVSDHGAGPLRTAFFLNNWLKRAGLLRLRGDFAALVRSRRWRGRLAALKRLVTRPIRRLAGRADGDDRGDEMNSFFSVVDWETTVAFSEGVAGGIYLNRERVEPGRREAVLSEIVRGLLAVRGAQGEQVVDRVCRPGEIYHGEALPSAPDLIVLCRPGYQVIAPNEMFFHRSEYRDELFLPHRWSGRHEQQGIFLLRGPAVRRGAEVEGCSVVDVAPTVLYLMGEPVPEYMDGAVLGRALDDDFVRSNPPRTAAGAAAEETPGRPLSPGEESEVLARMRDLGYME